MNQHHRRHALAATVATLALALTGCGDDGATEPSAERTQVPATTAPTGVTTQPGAAPTEDAATATAAPTGSAVGELVADFPTDVVPVPPEAEVTMSSVVPADDRLQVTLSGSTSQTADQVVDFYRGPLTEQGFEEAPATLPEGVLGATFTRGGTQEILTLTIIAAEDGTQQFTIGGFVVP